jgi:hypothetical protein
MKPMRLCFDTKYECTYLNQGLTWGSERRVGCDGSGVRGETASLALLQRPAAVSWL